MGDEVWLIKSFHEVREIKKQGKNALMVLVTGMPWWLTIPVKAEVWARDPKLVPAPIPVHNGENAVKEEQDDQTEPIEEVASEQRD